MKKSRTLNRIKEKLGTIDYIDLDIIKFEHTGVRDNGVDGFNVVIYIKIEEHIICSLYTRYHEPLLDDNDELSKDEYGNVLSYGGLDYHISDGKYNYDAHSVIDMYKDIKLEVMDSDEYQSIVKKLKREEKIGNVLDS